jgi:DNA polymerase III delta prime subunit
MPSSDVAGRMSAQVGAWRDELINLTRTNRLLYFRHTQSASIEIVEPGMVKVFDLLQRDRFWEFYEPPVDQIGRSLPRTRPARATELITDKNTPTQLAKSLRAIERRALDTFTERGLWTMYVGVGFLNWIDPKDDKPVETPLLLQPVEFGRNTLSEPFRLRATDDDAILNPALVVKLANDLGITLLSLDDLDDVSPESVFAAMEPFVRKRSGWSLVDRSVLHPFSFLKEAMYRDLLDHEAEIVDHPLVQVLALGSSAPKARDLVFTPVPFEQLDHYVTPEDLHHVRDADASQRRCVLAARDGHSFVMDGPPGTGKSQTITNIIAELLFEGKTVLFVSDKAAALEVVHKRLREAKLDEFALELHSHNATRKAVANELGLALSRHPRVKPQMSGLDKTKLVKARERLASYAEAINAVRPPLNRSLHDVLGRLAELSGYMSAPAPASITLNLSTPALAELVEWAEALGRAWGPVERSESFLWRDLQSNDVGPSVSEARRRTLEDTMHRIDALETRLKSVDDELGLGLLDDRAAAVRLVDVLRLLDERHDIEPTWLHAPDPAALAQTIATASVGIGELNGLAASLTREYGDAWRETSGTDATAFATSLAAIDANELATSVTDEHTVSDLQRDQDRLARGVDSFCALEDGTRKLAAAFRVNDGTVTLTLLTRLAQLAQLADPVQRPEPGWFGRAQSSDVAEARRVLDGLISELKAARTRAEEVFRPTVVELDLKGLRARFAAHGASQARRGIPGRQEAPRSARPIREGRSCCH